MYRSRVWLSVGIFFLATLAPSCSVWTDSAHDWAVIGVNETSLLIIVAVGSGDCDRFERVFVEETAEEVTITAVVETRSTTLPGQSCQMDMNFEYVEITLEEPLGDRVLLGCAPGGLDGMGDYFSKRERGRQGPDCAEVVDGW